MAPEGLILVEDIWLLQPIQDTKQHQWLIALGDRPPLTPHTALLAFSPFAFWLVTNYTLSLAWQRQLRAKRRSPWDAKLDSRDGHRKAAWLPFCGCSLLRVGEPKLKHPLSPSERKIQLGAAQSLASLRQATQALIQRFMGARGRTLRIATSSAKGLQASGSV